MSTSFPQDVVQKDYPLLDSRDSISIAGRKILGFYLIRMLNNEAGTKKGDDVEALHDMRVAIRRMRVIIRLFEDFYDIDLISYLRKALQKTGKTLGRVRDLDVLILMLDDNFKGVTQYDSPDDRQFYNWIRSYWDGKRVLARDNMLTYLEDEKFQIFKTRFRNFLNSTEYDLARKKILHFVPMLIAINLENILAYDDIFPHPSPDQLHAFRIAIKQLRYTIEFIQSMIGCSAVSCLDFLKKLQTHLGKINDIRVAIESMVEIFYQSQYDRDAVSSGFEGYITFKKNALEAEIIKFCIDWESSMGMERLKSLVSVLSTGDPA